MDNRKFYNILIVEDDENSFLYLLFALENKNYKIYRAVDGLEAINLFKDGQIHFDLVLMDLKLPVVDGYTATEEIRKLRPDIPIIAQTASYFKAEQQKLLDYRMNDVLIKPYTTEVLFKTIQSFLIAEKEHLKVF
jgi:two-component system, cell cycle response regulator DivK